MCDPGTAMLVGTLASAGGSFLQSREANKNAKRVQNAKNEAYEANMVRQRQYADEAGTAFGENIDKQGRENFDEQKAGEADRFKAAFGDVKTQPDYNQGLKSSTPKNVVLAREAASNEASDKTQRDVDSLAELTGYGGAMFNQGLDRNGFARLFGNLQDEASRDSNLLGLDVQAAANNAQKGPSLFPTLLKTAGQAASMYGAANAPSGFAFGGQSGSVSPGGAPLPGVKPTYIKNPFGSQIGAV